MRPQPSRVDARQVRLVEINRPLYLAVAYTAERSQIPLVSVQVMHCKDIGTRPILDFAELATPAGSPYHPS